jgi:transcriptional regulator with XRE-family HTH domain
MGRAATEYVRHVLATMRISATGLARRSGVASTTLTRALNDPDHKFALSMSTIQKIASSTGISPAPFFGIDEAQDELTLAVLTQSAPVLVAGRVAAGSFLEVDEFDQSEPERFWEPVDGRFPKARRMAFDVAEDSDSMNALKPRAILPGDRLICVSWEDVADQVKIRDGLIVIVERTRDGGQTREWSVKQVELYEDRIEFCPRSTNSKHKPIVVPRDATADEGTKVEIIGLVRSVRNDFAI